MCVSWPQACILPGCVLLYGTSTSSCMQKLAGSPMHSALDADDW